VRWTGEEVGGKGRSEVERGGASWKGEESAGKGRSEAALPLGTGTCVHSARRRSMSAMTSSCPRLKNMPSLVRIALGTLLPVFKGLHSLTLQLNVSAFCGIGGGFRGCLGGVYGGIRGIRRCLGCILRHRWLRLS
jgi:hypothetical protein